MKLLKVLFLFSALNSSLGERIFFEKCNHKGFTCLNATEVGEPQKIIYRCNQVYRQDVTIYLWQFLKPTTKTTIIVRDCHAVKFYFGCTSDRRNDFIQLLHVQNVSKVHFIPAALSHNPPTIIFENVNHIDTIPAGTFSQIKYKTFKPGCFNPTSDLDSLIFQNVKIDTIETTAFENLRNVRYFRWENVSVGTIKSGGIAIKGRDDMNMQILNSDIKVLKPLAVEVSGEKLIILGSIIGQADSRSLNGYLEVFEFSYNLVKNIDSGGFSILSRDVDITANHFEHLRSGALQQIAPPAITKLSNLKFVYKFRQNFIKHADAGSLHPNIVAYKNFNADVRFINNTFHCTCEGLAWLGAGVQLGIGYHYLEDFHKTMFLVENNNNCEFASCALPLNSMKDLISASEQCKQINKPDICLLYKSKEDAPNVSSRLKSVENNLNAILFALVCIFSAI